MPGTIQDSKRQPGIERVFYISGAYSLVSEANDRVLLSSENNTTKAMKVNNATESREDSPGWAAIVSRKRRLTKQSPAGRVWPQDNLRKAQRDLQGYP